MKQTTNTVPLVVLAGIITATGGALIHKVSIGDPNNRLACSALATGQYLDTLHYKAIVGKGAPHITNQ